MIIDRPPEVGGIDGLREADARPAPEFPCCEAVIAL
jgi:hypothetical protein